MRCPQCDKLMRLEHGHEMESCDVAHEVGGQECKERQLAQAREDGERALDERDIARNDLGYMTQKHDFAKARADSAEAILHAANFCEAHEPDPGEPEKHCPACLAAHENDLRVKAEEVIERWQVSSMLENAAGDPEGITPDDNEKNACALMAEVERPRDSWRCWHCGKTFTDTNEAEEHFGHDPDGNPVCIEVLRVEVKRLREILAVVPSRINIFQDIVGWQKGESRNALVVEIENGVREWIEKTLAAKEADDGD